MPWPFHRPIKNAGSPVGNPTGNFDAEYMRRTPDEFAKAGGFEQEFHGNLRLGNSHVGLSGLPFKSKN